MTTADTARPAPVVPPPVTRPTAVVARALRKTYRDGTEAVRGLDLTVAQGETFGFLGPNGAGKTTAISILCTLLRPTSGTAAVAGHDVVRSPADVRRRIGLVFQEQTLDIDLTAEENLRFHAELYGVPRRTARVRIGELLELMGLSERAGAPVRTFSGGMRRRLEIARGLLHTPSVLFLDEPATGLDPQTRATIWEHLHALRREHAVTLFLTTHQLQEAENCDRIAVMDAGRTVVDGTPSQLKAVVGADLVELRTGDDGRAADVITRHFGIRPERDAAGLRLRVAEGATFVPRLCATLPVPVLSITVTPPTLDDVFLHWTGRSIREAGS